MSIDMTMATREAVLESDERIEASAPATPIWLQDTLAITGTAFGVLLSSVVGVLLFLR